MDVIKGILRLLFRKKASFNYVAHRDDGNPVYAIGGV